MAARCSSEAYVVFKKELFLPFQFWETGSCQLQKNFSSSLYETEGYYVFFSRSLVRKTFTWQQGKKKRGGGMWWVCIFPQPLVRWITIPCGCDWYADAAKYERDTERREAPSLRFPEKNGKPFTACPAVLYFFSTEEEAPKFPSISSPTLSLSYSKVLSSPPPPPPRHKQTGSSEGPALNSL